MIGTIRTLAAATLLAASFAIPSVAHAQARVAPTFQPTMHHAPIVASSRRTAADSALPAPLAAGGFATSGFAQAMASPAGRVVRVLAGAAMVAGGIAMDSNGGTVLAVAGAMPISAGLFDICWLSPIFGGPIRGRDIRVAKTQSP